jgi:cyclophilin family peptidyl-prolyl cis-trans isomerase
MSNKKNNSAKSKNRVQSTSRSAKTPNAIKSSAAAKKNANELVIGGRTFDQTQLLRIAAGVVILLVVIAVLVYLNGLNKPAATPPSAAGMPTLVATAKYSSAPPMAIDQKKTYTATFKMAKGGEFVIQLYPDKAPITVNSFVFLARQKFFDGLTFHRVLEGFMAQGGDPAGTGGGGPGYEFVNESSDLTFDKAGVLAMANAGKDTNGSQFFITFAPQPSLNGGYTIFGQVTSGMDVVNAITRRDPQSNPTTPGDAIASVTITEK